MKKLFGGMIVLLLASAPAFADVSVDVDNGNEIINTNTADADARSNQNQDQKQRQQQGQTVVYRGNLPTVGFNGYLNPGTTDGIRWREVCSEIYMGWTVEDIENARDRFSFGDFITFNWGSNAEFTLVGKPLAENNRPVSCVDYWPRTKSHQGDRILGAVDIQGEPGTPDEAYIAQAYGLCKEKTGSSRVALLIGDVGESVTTGASFNLSGALSKISGGGDSGSAVASGIGVGKARISREEKVYVKALCMNDAPRYVTPPPPPLVVKPEPKPVFTCDENEILRRLGAAEKRIATCYRYCYDNMADRLTAGMASFELWLCTGNVIYLENAIEHLQMGELNYIHGYDIKNHADSDEVLTETEYWLATAFFAKDHSIKAYLKAPRYVKHENKRTGADKWVKATKYEKDRIKEIRSTLEKYSEKPVLK